MASEAGFVDRLILRREEVPDFDVFPFCVPAIRHLSTLAFNAQVTFFIGENGSGKSTLVEAIAIAAGFNAEGGSKNFNFSTFSSHTMLQDYLTLVRNARRETDGFFLRAESFYNVASQIQELDEGTKEIIGAYGGISLHEQSHGESFMSLAAHRFRGKGLYLLDEPEAALSPVRQLSLLKIIHRLVTEKGSQFVIATHSPILMAFPGALIYALSDQGIQETCWEDTEHVTLTKSFLDRPDAFLRRLFKD